MLKDALSGLRKFSVTESPLKLKALYFTLNTLFIFKVFKFLPLLFFGHVEKKFDKVRQIRLISKIYDVTTWETSKLHDTYHISQ